MENNARFDVFSTVGHGLLLSVLALILGLCWAGYLAVNHEQLHGEFEKQEAAMRSAQIHHTVPDMLGMISDYALPRAEAHGNEPHPSEQGAHADHQDAHQQHSHSGSLATDAMQRLMRGHIHWMGVGVLSAIMLLIVAFTSLKMCWKKLLGWTFGIGAVTYPLSWILMGFRTVILGPEGAEASVLWLFGPAVALLLGSLLVLFAALFIEETGLKDKGLFSWAFAD